MLVAMAWWEFVGLDQRGHTSQLVRVSHGGGQKGRVYCATWPGCCVRAWPRKAVPTEVPFKLVRGSWCRGGGGGWAFIFIATQMLNS